MAEYSQKWHNGTFKGRSTETSDGLAAIQAQLNNLGREIKKVNEKVYVAQRIWMLVRDNEMGDIIFGEPFLREVGIKTKRFEGIITLYNGDNEVTYQMVRSHPKFKHHHTNEQCNKIPPLLKTISAIEMLWEWRGIANMDFIQLGGSSRVDEMILARERSGFAGKKVWDDIPVVTGFVGRERRLLGK
ncbi:hypothetical protein Tco_1406533 [Tanacetum coccineum]